MDVAEDFPTAEAPPATCSAAASPVLGFLLSEKKINKILQGPTSEKLGHITGIITGTAGFPYLRGVFFRANGVGPLRLGDPQLEVGKAEWQAAIDLINAYAGLNGKKMHFESGTCYPSLKGGFRERWLCCSLKRKKKPECHFRLKLTNILPADLVVRDGPAFPPDVTPGIYIEEIGLRAYKDKEGTGGVGHNHDEATVFGDVIPSVVLPSAWIDSFTPLYKSLDDVPFLVKDNFSILLPPGASLTLTLVSAATALSSTTTCSCVPLQMLTSSIPSGE